MFIFIWFLYFKQSNKYVEFKSKSLSQLYQDKDQTVVTYCFNKNEP